MSAKLSERALLVHLTVHQWMGRMKDEGASRELASQKQATSEAGTTVLISLAPKRFVNPIDNAGWAARLEHQRLTLPWLDGGHRILPSRMVFEYTEAVRAKTAVFNQKIQEFLTVYPELMEEAVRKQRLGELGKGIIIPSVEELRYRFRIFTDMLPMPDTTDFRVDLADDQLVSIRSDIEHNIAEKMKLAQNDLWKRLTNLIEKFQVSMAEPDKVFRDSLIGNLKDFCVMIPKMNIVDDENLEGVRQQVMDKLGGLKPSLLRLDGAARKQAAKDAKEVLDKMKDYF